MPESGNSTLPTHKSWEPALVVVIVGTNWAPMLSTLNNSSAYGVDSVVPHATQLKDVYNVSMIRQWELLIRLKRFIFWPRETKLGLILKLLKINCSVILKLMMSLKFVYLRRNFFLMLFVIIISKIPMLKLTTSVN